ncbi:MAG: hypothetical protein JHD15_10845 [Phenylobacterium sp.]|uniref:hypothetical protein n=1 Tax=Phenylobacterium sp. TaxID=1871053 RepID=UPI001A1B5553|nr:hypothetical protein [Phenylobacterium sp.]MBJ7410840.1 hypothetical protein [Phenylobacterium sp.]
MSAYREARGHMISINEDLTRFEITTDEAAKRRFAQSATVKLADMKAAIARHERLFITDLAEVESALAPYVSRMDA